MHNTKHVGFLPVDLISSADLLKLQGAALDATGNALVITNLTGTVIWVNSAFERLTGYTYAEMVGQNPRVLKSGQNSRKLYEEMWQTILDGGVWRGELINRRKDGSLYDEEMTITPIRDSPGEITHFIANKLDISERRQAETTLRLLTERLSLATSSAKVGVWELDIASNAFTWDATMFEIYDFSPIVPIPYTTWSAAVFPEDLPIVEAILRKAIDKKGQGSAEFRIILKDGTVRNVSVVGRAVLDEQARVRRVLGIAQDITERKRTELAVQQEKNFNLAIIESLPGLFYLVGEHGQMLRGNTALSVVSGYSAEEISTMSILDFFKEPDKSHIADRMQHAFSKGDTVAEVSLVAKNQTETPYLFSAKRFVFEGKSCLVVFGVDISERKRIEKRLQDSESKYRALFDDSADATLLRYDKGFIDCNSAALKMFGYTTVADIMALHPADFSPPNQPDGTSSQAGSEQKIATAFLQGQNHFEWWHQRKDGEVFPAEVTLTALTVNGRQAVIGTVRDITERKKMEQELLQMAAIVESSEDAIIGKTLNGTIQTWNGGAVRMYEYSAAEAIGKPISMLFRREEQDQTAAILEKVKQGEMVKCFETIRMKKDGEHIHIDLTVSPIHDVAGRIIGASTIARDVSERVKAEERLLLWSRVLEQSAEGIFVCDPQENILLVNTAFEKLTGFSASDAVGKTPRILQSGRQDHAFYADMWKSVSEKGVWRGEMWNRRKSGEIYVEWLSISAVCNHQGSVTHYIGIFSDITVRKHAEERVVHLAHYDALTDLPNRVLLMDRLNQLTKAAQRRISKVAVVFIDLDRFKEVNDSLGHDAGDLLLQTVAKRFSGTVRNEDTVARLGGDEFVVVLQGLHDGQDVALPAQKLLSCLVEPITLNGYELTVTASMGISVYPDDADNGQEMIRNADAAMYTAKGAGRNSYHFYTSDLNQRALEMLSTENALRRAIEHHEFVLHYQPQVDISSGRVVGAEALIRWNHPELGLVMPGRFISIAEERGLIVPIGSWVIEEAARQAAVWRKSERLSIPIAIAVNVSAVQFRQKDFVERLANIVQVHGITPDLIELELTESIIMRDAETTIEILKKLHDIGFRLSIDDFGTGYSSLSYLRRFPIDKIKIDQSFVMGITQYESSASIATAVIGLAKSLKLKVIAEGVETKEQLEILREQRCDEAQGFLFSPPLVSGEFEKLVREWKPKYLVWPGLCPII